MSLFADILGALPKEVKFVFGIAIFLFAGSTILQVLIFAWNFFVIGGTNLVNGCVSDPALCIPTQEGLFVFGINFADYWTVAALIFFPMLILFAIKWYAVVLKRD